MQNDTTTQKIERILRIAIAIGEPGYMPIVPLLTIYGDRNGWIVGLTGAGMKVADEYASRACPTMEAALSELVDISEEKLAVARANAEERLTALRDPASMALPAPRPKC